MLGGNTSCQTENDSDLYYLRRVADVVVVVVGLIARRGGDRLLRLLFARSTIIHIRPRIVSFRRTPPLEWQC